MQEVGVPSIQEMPLGVLHQLAAWLRAEITRRHRERQHTREITDLLLDVAVEVKSRQEHQGW